MNVDVAFDGDFAHVPLNEDDPICWLRIQRTGKNKIRVNIQTHDNPDKIEVYGGSYEINPASLPKKINSPSFGLVADIVRFFNTGELDTEMSFNLRKTAGEIYRQWCKTDFEKKDSDEVQDNSLWSIPEQLEVFELEPFGFIETGDRWILTELTWVQILEDGQRVDKPVVCIVDSDRGFTVERFLNPETYGFDNSTQIGRMSWMMSADALTNAKEKWTTRTSLSSKFDLEDKKNIRENLFDAIDNHVWHYREADRLLQFCWTAHTYVYDLFNHTPILNVLGPSDSGKSDGVCSTINATGYHAKTYINPTEAAIFRLKHLARLTLIVDENDQISSNNKDIMYRIKQLLRASWSKRGGEVPRTEERDGVRTVVDYNTFSPTVSSGIEGLEGVLESRSIPFTMTRYNGDNEYNSANPLNYKELRDMLYIFRMTGIERVILERDFFAREGIHEEIKGRQFDNWLPIFVMARIFLTDEEYNTLQDHALIVVRSYKNVPRNIQDSERVLNSLMELYKQDGYIKVRDIVENVHSWTQINWSEDKIGRILKRLGFLNKNRIVENKRKYTVYWIERQFLRDKVVMYLGETALLPDFIKIFWSQGSNSDDKDVQVVHPDVVIS